MKFNSVALFCEDIRDEVGGAHTLVGVLPDNLQLQASEGAQAGLPKLGVYCRTHVPISETPEQLEILLTVGSTEQVVGSLDREFVAKAIAEATANGSPHAGLITKLVASPFPVGTDTRVMVIVRTASQQVEAAALNIKLVSAPPG